MLLPGRGNQQENGTPLFIGEIMKVLLAVSKPEVGAAAARFVTSRAWPENTEFMFLGVAEPHITDFGICFPSDETKELKRVINGQVRALRALVPDSKVTGRVESGMASATIVQIAQDWPADLLVVGSGMQQCSANLTPCNIVERIILQSPCPLEVLTNEQTNQAIGNKEASRQVAAI